MPADPKYDTVHPLAIPGKYYGCHNKPRPIAGSDILNSKGEPSGVKHVMSTECKYDKSHSDVRCEGCKHIRFLN